MRTLTEPHADTEGWPDGNQQPNPECWPSPREPRRPERESVPRSDPAGPEPKPDSAGPAPRVPRPAPERGASPEPGAQGAECAAGTPISPSADGAEQRPRIDPRFIRRRIEVLRDQGRRRLRIFIVAVSVPVAAGLLAASLYTPLFAAHHVTISIPGASRSEVLRVAGLGGSPPMIDVNPGAIAARLDAIPVWGDARVAKSWPSTIHVGAAVRRPVAVVAVPGANSRTSSRWAEVDVTGRVLADVTTAPAGLPALSGVGAGVPPSPGRWYAGSDGPTVAPGGGATLTSQLRAPEDSTAMPGGIGAALAVAAALPAHLRSELLGIVLGPGGQLTLSLLPVGASSPISALLGDGSLLGAKLTAVVTLLAQADLTGVTAIDATVPDRPVTLTAR